MTRPADPLGAVCGGLIVSCQAYPGDPMRDPETMRRMAQACLAGGAVGIRAQGLDDLRAIMAVTEVPVIGLVKTDDPQVYITPTLEAALQVAGTGCAMVAVDGTSRPRGDGLTLAQTVSAVHEASSILVMADVSCLDEALAAQDAGADLIGTTLAGYTPARELSEGPDLELLEQVVAIATVPVIAEGRIHTPEHARQALELGAHAVVVGAAITRPATITSWFVDALSR